ncbi:MAG: hypothetical protein AAF996_07865 [Pseudomonadota bacterium]
MGRVQISKSAIRASYLEQAKLTQAHAWLALGMSNERVSARAEQLQANGFEIEISESDQLGASSLSLAQRSDLVRSAVLEDAWRLDAGTVLRVEGVIADPNNEGSFFNIQISFSFEPEPALLPPIAKIQIEMTGDAENPGASADLVKSRLLSTNHRWHTLVEDPNRTPEPFQELLGERFKMEFGHGSVSSYEEFRQWVYGSASSVNASRHDMESVSWRPLDSDEYEAIFVLDWLGLNKDDKTMVAKTKHTWTFSNDPSEAYPRIQHMDVSFLEPFSVIE